MNRPRYETLFFFDRTVPRELYYSVQRRLNLLGFGAAWQPRSAMSRVRDMDEIAKYCVSRGIVIIATFYRDLKLPECYEDELVVLKLRSGKETVNKIISSLFILLRSGGAGEEGPKVSLGANHLPNE